MTMASNKKNRLKSTYHRKKKKPGNRGPGFRGSLRRYALWFALLMLPMLFWQGTIFYVQLRARALIAERNPREARRWVSWVNKFSLRSKTNEFLLARCARKLGDYQGLAIHLTKAFDLGYDPIMVQREDWLASAQTGNLLESEPHLAELINDPRGDGQEICEAYVMGYLLIQQYMGAEEILKGWANAYPHDPQPWYLRGVVFRDVNKWKESETAFRRTLSIDPDYAEAAFQLGSVLLTLKKTDEAFKFFEQAARQDDLQAECRVGQAHCYRLLGNPVKAREILDSVIADHPNEPSAALELGRLSLAGGDYKSAIHWLEPLVRKDRRNTDARYSLASALSLVGRTEDAQTHFDAVAEINDHLADANQLSESINTSPESADDRLKIGLIHMQYGSEVEGLTWLRGALSVNPQHRPTVEAMLIYYQNKITDKPDNPTYRSTLEKFKQMLREIPSVDKLPETEAEVSGE
jgi:tetratricopeptide (TPR) repeat protein